MCLVIFKVVEVAMGQDLNMYVATPAMTWKVSMSVGHGVMIPQCLSNAQVRKKCRIKIFENRNNSISHWIIDLNILLSCRDISNSRWSSNNISCAIYDQKGDYEALRSMQERETKTYLRKYLSPSVSFFLYWRCRMQRNWILGRK